MTAPSSLAHIAPGHDWVHLAGEPHVVVGLAAVTAAYIAAGRRSKRRAGAARWEPACFAAGVLVLAVALTGPLDGLAGSLFAAHMAQHVLVTTVAPPLLLLGRPGRRILRLLPTRWSSPAGRLHRRARRLLAAGGPGTGIAAAVAVHVVTVWAWHVPVLYETAVHHRAVHGLEHALFLGSALWFWDEVIRTHRRSTHVYGLIGLFVVGAAGAALGVLLAFSSRVAYPVHAAGAAASGFTSLEDQQIAAVGMWMGGGLVYVAAAVAVTTRWLAAGTGHGGLPAAAPVVAGGPRR